MLANLLNHFVLQRLILQPQGVPTKVVCLTQALNVDDLRDDDEYEDIVEDMRQEGGKYGKILLNYLPQFFLMGIFFNNFLCFLLCLYLCFTALSCSTFCYKESSLTYTDRRLSNPLYNLLDDIMCDLNLFDLFCFVDSNFLHVICR